VIYDLQAGDFLQTVISRQEISGSLQLRRPSWQINKINGISGQKKVKKRLSLHLTLTGNITRRYWLLPFEGNNY
jgi:hypothetical protein